MVDRGGSFIRREIHKHDNRMQSRLATSSTYNHRDEKIIQEEEFIHRGNSIGLDKSLNHMYSSRRLCFVQYYWGGL